MKECPFCQKSVPDDAPTRVRSDGTCAHCGRSLIEPLSAGPRVEYEPTPAERARLAEIRRLQQIARGVPTRADRMARLKGLLALGIIICILVYVYVWRQTHEAPDGARRVPSEVTFEAFNVLFGPGSPLEDSEKLQEFRYYRTARVRWTGTVSYVNLGAGDDLYVTLRRSTRIPSSDVLLRFPEERRSQIAELQPGQTIAYGGRLIEFDRGTNFITLGDGVIYRVR